MHKIYNIYVHGYKQLFDINKVELITPYFDELLENKGLFSSLSLHSFKLSNKGLKNKVIDFIYKYAVDKDSEEGFVIGKKKKIEEYIERKGKNEYICFKS
jgi:hypothetical protein